MSVLLNSGHGAFAPSVSYGGTSASYALVIGDLDGDRDPELALVNGSGVTVLPNLSH